MNTPDADDLATLITKTWRGGPSTDVWAEELGTLYTAQARAAYTQLRRSEQHAPSVATFLAAYRSLGTTRTEDPQRPCTTCDGTGLVIVEAPDWHRPGCPRPAAIEKIAGSGRIIAVYPCGCHAAAPCTQCRSKTPPIF